MTRYKKRIKKNKMRLKKAFTLVELIVVMAIIAILVLLAAPRFIGYTKDAKVTAMAYDTKVLGDAAEQYHAENGAWPIVMDSPPISVGIGGVAYLYPLDPEQMNEAVQTFSEDYADYGLATEGEHQGDVFHIATLLADVPNTRPNHPIVFDGTAYTDISNVPESSSQVFVFEAVPGGMAVVGLAPGRPIPTAIRIPDTYQNKPVVAIGKEAFINKNLSQVVLPETLQTIGVGAFRYNALTNVFIPDSVRELADGAFHRNQIAVLRLPERLLKMGTWAFNDNQLPKEQAFIYARDKNGLEIPTDLASYGGAERNNLVIPDTITTLKPYALWNVNLTGVTIPTSIRQIEPGAFTNNLLLPSQAFIYERLPDGRINDKKIVGYGGAERTHVQIPEGVTHLAAHALSENSIQSVTLPNTLVAMGPYAFLSNALSEITIPPHVTTIPTGAFQANQLVSLTLPDTVTSIDEGAFYRNQLTQVTIPTSVRKIGAWAFNKNQLPETDATIFARHPDGSWDRSRVVSYGGNATHVRVPNSVKTIGKWAYWDTGITAVTVPEQVSIIELGAFEANGTNGNSLSLPSGPYGGTWHVQAKNWVKK